MFPPYVLVEFYFFMMIFGAIIVIFVCGNLRIVILLNEDDWEVFN